MSVENLKIAIASDHAGYELKEKIKEKLSAQGFLILDCGTNSNESCDYPDYGHALANKIQSHEADRGIIMCGTGNGIGMTVNRHKGVRAALCWNESIAKLAREHNDANVLDIPAKFVSEELAFKMIDIFLNTAFEGGRHLNRIKKIEDNE